MAWKVQRWSGRQSDELRIVYEGGDAKKARTLFDKIRSALRQGEVRLSYPDGNTVESVHAPNLRTRW